MLNVVNYSKTGIPAIDNGITDYFYYLANINVLPPGTYVLAGGSIRSLLDNTRVKDLDIYILGSKQEHEDILNAIQPKTRAPEDFGLDECNVIDFESPFSRFSLFTFKPELFKCYDRTELITHTPSVRAELITHTPSVRATAIISLTSNIPVQLISFAYDSGYSNRALLTINRKDRFVDTYASTNMEIVGSFDLTISKGSVEFTISDDYNYFINSVHIPYDCLMDVCMRKLRLATENKVIPKQVCSLKRFHKFLTLGYTPDNDFYSGWNNKLKTDPYSMTLGIEYD